MMRLLLQALALVTIAVACAAASNAFAGAERRLAWRGPAVSGAVEGRAPRSGASAPAAAASRAAPSPTAASSTAAAPAQAKSFAPHPNAPFEEIGGEDAAVLQARGDAPFLDARRTAVYRQGHIAGARPFSVWESDVDDKVKAFFAEGHEPSAPIVVYCSGGECEDSHTLAQKLYLVGFDAVFVYKDGFPDWQRRGLPVHIGERP